jgi:hypothetical protein
MPPPQVCGGSSRRNADAEALNERNPHDGLLCNHPTSWVRRNSTRHFQSSFLIRGKAHSVFLSSVERRPQAPALCSVRSGDDMEIFW